MANNKMGAKIMEIKTTNKFKYKATIDLTLAFPENFNMEKFESKLDLLVEELAEEQDAEIYISNFRGAN